MSHASTLVKVCASPRALAWVPECFVAVVLACWAPTCVAQGAESTTKLQYQRGETLAVAQIGLSAKGETILRRIEYGVASFVPGEGQVSALAQCIGKSDVLARRDAEETWIGKRLRAGLSRIETDTKPQAIFADQGQLEQSYDYAEAYRNASVAQQLHLNATAVVQVSSLLGDLSAEFEKRLTAAGCPDHVGKVFLALVQRPCSTDGADCKVFRGERDKWKYLAGNQQANRFDLLLKWAHAFRADVPPQAPATDVAYAKGLLLANQFVVIDANGAAPPTKLDERVIDSFPIAVEVSDSKVAQENLERLVDALRARRQKQVANDSSPERIPVQTLRMLNVSQQIFVRIADVFAQADYVFRDLPSRPSDTLLAIADKTAAMRLRECLLNQRKGLLNTAGQPDLVAISACTGYHFSTLEQVGHCLEVGRPSVPDSKGGQCAPLLKTVDPAGLVQLAGTLQFGPAIDTAKQLADGSLIGRLGGLRYDELSKKIFDGCSNATDQALARCAFEQHFVADKKSLEVLQKIQGCSALNKGGSVDVAVTGLVDCVGTAGMGARELARLAAAKDCSQSLIRTGSLADCALSASVDEETLRRLQCLRRAGDVSTRAECIAKDLPGLDVAKYQTCGSKASQERVKCLATLAGVPKLADAVGTCVNLQSTSALLSCADGIGIKVDPKLSEALACMSKDASYAKALVCASNGSIKGDAGKVLGCATQANFDGPGTAACVVGGMLKFNDDLMMAATCMASTGGEPVSAGVCTFGKLAMREFTYCRNARFGEGKCFGKNNTLVKALNIGPNSTVASVINLQMDIVKGVVAFTQNPGRAVGEFASNVGRELTKVRDDVYRAFDDLGNGLRKEASRIFGKGIYIKVPKIKIRF